jgi:pSer/pThr/pTyr-binding forkhead associated (FHA) protein
MVYSFMAFQLVIAEGKESGREFIFDQNSVLIGRTTECDIILYDSGVSRTHARIFSEGPLFFVEDLGSSNGTKINGELVKKQGLNEGDKITLGPVIFAFTPLAEVPEEIPTGEAPAQGGDHTRVVLASELKSSRNRGVAMVPQNAAKGELEAIKGRSTSMLPALKGSQPSGLRMRSSSPGQRALTPAEPAKSSPSEEVETGPVSKRRRASPTPLSAAERSRYRREGISGSLRIWWAQANAAKRALVSMVVVILTVASVGGLAFALGSDGEKPQLPEPQKLTGEPLKARFGLGEKVDYEKVDSKSFDFDVASPVQVMVVVQLQSKGIDTREEISVSVNGVDLGFLPPDTDNADEATHEIIVPAVVVRRNESNTITFDNVRNPPEADPWQIWNIWIEIAVLPERDQQGLALDALEKFNKGEQKSKQVDLGTQNLWDSYKFFRESWLTLEALPAASRTTTYDLARMKMKEARVALDHKCLELLKDATMDFQFKRWADAREKLNHVKAYFPTNGHPCLGKAERLRYEFDL